MKKGDHILFLAKHNDGEVRLEGRFLKNDGKDHAYVVIPNLDEDRKPCLCRVEKSALRSGEKEPSMLERSTRFAEGSK